jgi:membrane protein
VLRQYPREIVEAFKSSYSRWSEHDDQTAAAALSYFAALSLAPLLVFTIAITEIVFGHEGARNAILNQMTALTGNAGGESIKNILEHGESPQRGIIASVVSVLMLIVGASGVFSHLRTALNRIWDVKPKEHVGIGQWVREQFFSYIIVIGVGFLLLVSLLVSGTLAAAGKFIGGFVPAFLLQTVNLVISLAAITILFAVMYRVVPERTLPWRRLWVGSFATAVLFTLGKHLLGLYLGHFSVGSAYGAAGSLVVLLVWLYYSSNLFLLGAEFTRLHAYREAKAEGQPLPEAA